MELTDTEIFAAHEGGKMSTRSLRPLLNQRDLSVAYTPGVARVSSAIAENPELARDYTWSGRNVAVISDGTAVLGLGNIGPKGALPVMEGKAQLFEAFAKLSAVPVVLSVTDTEEVIAAVKAIAPSFGAINLEDISAPRCFEIERRLIEELDIPIMHDDQHGTAIVMTAALQNACRLLNRELSSLKVVISGAGAAGVAGAKMLYNAGVRNIIMLDSRGIVSKGRDHLNAVKEELLTFTNPENVVGGPVEALTGADTFIGVSAGEISEEAVAAMAEPRIIFALANPNPEVKPEIAAKYHAIYATGRSDLPNQINNVLAFPGIFDGALNAKAKKITTEMKLAASQAIADLAVPDLDLDYIIPSPLDRRVEPAVSRAVEAVARQQIADGTI
ncbi:MAG: NADP-dependent malic enzyme [Corynebacterium sp.]|nr:NADP-dependent malic enzyme [Corynebacterium sp.]